MPVRIALATYADLPDLFTDDDPLRAALLARGAVPVPAVWDDPEQDWAAYDLVVVRSTWDYHERRDAFVAWARSVPRLLNPASIVEWNTDKTYLRGLAEAGVPVVPTAWVTDGTPLREVLGAHGWTDVVVKPAVSAGARNTLRCNVSDLDAGETLLRKIVAQGVAMVQPYLASVEDYGERSLLFVEGTFGHAVRRHPALSTEGDERYDARLVTASEAELALATATLAAVGEPLLYARVDVVPDESGTPLLMELEVTEPQLFLRFSDATAALLADAIVARAGSAGSSTTTGS
jgi:glutathione synthase/RimK-type ligase-like ATP-grasp enzyme